GRYLVDDLPQEIDDSRLRHAGTDEAGREWHEARVVLPAPPDVVDQLTVGRGSCRSWLAPPRAGPPGAFCAPRASCGAAKRNPPSPSPIRIWRPPRPPKAGSGGSRLRGHLPGPRSG